MPAFIDGRQLANGEFVCVINGLTYVGRAQGWNYIQQSDQRLPTVTLNGVITDQQRNEPPADTQQRAVLHAPAGPRGRLTVQILPWGQLPLAGDRDTLYVVTTATLPSGRLFDEAAYVYRPADPGDDRPYKATNVSAAIVARLHDSGDLLPSQDTIARNSSAVPVHYGPSNPRNPLLVYTRDNFVAWMPIEWRLSEIPARSRPGHVVLPEVRNELARWSVDEIDEVTRREVLQAGSIARNTVAAALRTTIPDRPLPDPVVTYVSCLDELPVHGEEHRLYCIYGYEAAYVYRRGHTPPYCPTDLSAAELAENYPDGATFERVYHNTVDVVIPAFYTGDFSWRRIRPDDAQGPYFCEERFYLDTEEPPDRALEGRRANTAEGILTLPPTSAAELTTPIGDIRDELVRDAVAAIGAETDNRFFESMAAATPNQSATAAPVVTYVSCLDELPVQGEEHRLYCIYGYEAAYVYRRGQSPPYRPTNLSAAAVAEWYADGTTLERVPSALPTGIMVVFNNDYRGPAVWRTDDQGSFCCQGRLFIGPNRLLSCSPLEGRRDNTADHAFTLPAGTAIPTRAIQGDPVVVPIPRLTPEQLDDMHTWSRGAVTPQELFPRTPVRLADHMEVQLSVELPPAPQPPHTVPGRRRLILD